jgi:integrase/recombinase XerD
MQWQSTIDEFLKYLETERSSSLNTILAYRNDLGQFNDYLVQTVPVPVDSEWSTINQETIVGYVEVLTQRGYTKSTIARKIAALKTLFHWLSQHGQMHDDPTLRLKSPRVDKRTPRLLSPEEVNNLIDATSSVPQPRSSRDRALLEVVYSTGMRVSEAINLRLTDIDLELNEVRCMGRGNRSRKSPLLPRAVQALREYLENARVELLGNVSTDFVFLNPQGTKLTRQAVWLMTRQYAKTARIEGEVTPHTLRHSRAAHMLGDGQDVHRVQEWLGHANLATTQMYQPHSTKALNESRELEIAPPAQQPS